MVRPKLASRARLAVLGSAFPPVGAFTGAAGSTTHRCAAVAIAIGVSVSISDVLRLSAPDDRPRRGRVDEIVFCRVIKFRNSVPVHGVAEGRFWC